MIPVIQDKIHCYIILLIRYVLCLLVGVPNRIRDSEGGEFTEAGRMDFGEICGR